MTSPVWKIPRSVLVVIHTADLQVLLLRRADSAPGQSFWQSVTGAVDSDAEAWDACAAREVWEETGLDCRPGGPLQGHLSDWGLENVYEIYPQWRHRYAPTVSHNTERVLGLCVPDALPVRLSPREHTESVWLPWTQAAERCFSPSNAEAILWLPRLGGSRVDAGLPQSAP